MTSIAITGAGGDVGQQALEALDAYNVTPITHSEKGLGGYVLDVKDQQALQDAFEGHDVVLHLAADASPNASWESVKETNIHGTYNVYEAARKTDVERVVFASSHHIVHMENIDNPERAGTTKASPKILSPDAVPDPDSYYAISKITGEGIGSYYAKRFGLEVINLRIGWLLTESDLLDVREDSQARVRHARANWLSPRDCRNALKRSIEATPEENPLTVNIVSQNDHRNLTLTQALQALDYQPRDNSAEVFENAER